MISAVQDRKDWRNDNTEVLYSPSRNVSCVYLHKNLIATISKDEVEITIQVGNPTLPNTSQCYHQTMCDGYNQGVYQRDFTKTYKMTRMVLTHC